MNATQNEICFFNAPQERESCFTQQVHGVVAVDFGLHVVDIEACRLVPCFLKRPRCLCLPCEIFQPLKW